MRPTRKLPKFQPTRGVDRGDGPYTVIIVVIICIFVVVVLQHLGK